MAEATFPLVARGRIVGLSFGAMRSSRRGTGSDTAGSREYVPGDSVADIDWSASARLSSARGGNEFIVRVRGPAAGVARAAEPEVVKKGKKEEEPAE